MSNNGYMPLTVDGPATVGMIRSANLSVRGYAMSRGMAASTLQRMLNAPGSPHPYPYQPYKFSRFQMYLMQLKEDGFLVEQTSDQKAA